MEEIKVTEMVDKIRGGLQKIDAHFGGLPDSGKVFVTYTETDEKTGKVISISLRIPDAPFVSKELDSYFCRISPNELASTIWPAIESTLGT